MQVDLTYIMAVKYPYKIETVDDVQFSVSRQLIQRGTSAKPTYAPSEGISIGQD